MFWVQTEYGARNLASYSAMFPYEDEKTSRWHVMASWSPNGDDDYENWTCLDPPRPGENHGSFATEYQAMEYVKRLSRMANRSG